MAILYPNNLDTFTNPTNTTPVTDTHPNLHADINDAVEALEAKVGITSSTDATSLDYKVSQLQTSAITSTSFNTLFDARLALKSTSNIPEGTTLYYTTARVNSIFN